MLNMILLISSNLSFNLSFIRYCRLIQYFPEIDTRMGVSFMYLAYKTRAFWFLGHIYKNPHHVIYLGTYLYIAENVFG